MEQFLVLRCHFLEILGHLSDISGCISCPAVLNLLFQVADLTRDFSCVLDALGQVRRVGMG